MQAALVGLGHIDHATVRLPLMDLSWAELASIIEFVQADARRGRI